MSEGTIRLIAGLGNPGRDYEQTRHNAGFWFVDELARRCGVSFRPERRFHGALARCTRDGADCRLLKPDTFMNRSGQSVAAVLRFFDLAPHALLVAHDDLDLPPGTVRLKRGGRHGGHNGLRDLFAHVGSREFWRLRIGIGHPGERDQVVDYVLKKPARGEREAIDRAIDEAAGLFPEILAGRFEHAMQRLHSRAQADLRPSSQRKP